MNLKNEIFRIIGRKFSDDFNSIEFVKWAVRMVLSDYNSESLVILAGMDNDTNEEKEEYFWKSVEELNVNIPREKSELINSYAKFISNSVVSGDLCPREGLKQMNLIYHKSCRDMKYTSFFEINEDLEFLKLESSYQAIFNSRITLENADNFIRREFEHFIKNY